MLLDLIKTFSGNSVVYYFDITFEETLKRHKTKHNSHEFGETELRTWWIDKDYLQVADEVYIMDKLQENEIIKLIHRQIKSKA